MRAAWLIALKDLRLRLRDRSALMIGVVVPLALAFVFNAVFGGAFSGDSILTLGWVDEDGGQVADAFGQIVDAVAADGGIDFVSAADAAELEELIDDGDIGAGLVLPAGLSEAVEAGNPARIEVVAGVEAPTSSSVAESIALAFGTGVEDTQRAAAAVVASGTPDLVPAVIAAASRARPLLTFGTVESADRVLAPATFFSASMAVFFLFFMVQFGVTGLLDERREGTLTRLEAAPIPRWSILAGKAITSLVLGIFSMSVLALGTTLLIGADWGNPIPLFILFVFVTLAATSLIGVVGSVARTPEGAGNLTSALAVAMGMVGGTFFPVAGGSEWLERLALLTPHSWFLRAVGDLQAGEGLAGITDSLLALTAFTVGGLALGFVLSRVVRR
ncbi:MAG TPA: ABC transporter permease [Acidimicrobiia bacterium]|nr:ABC transporter permease [Acidimicrobiia bacterium]